MSGVPHCFLPLHCFGIVSVNAHRCVYLSYLTEVGCVRETPCNLSLFCRGSCFGIGCSVGRRF
jgi:hypothetical protein